MTFKITFNFFTKLWIVWQVSQNGTAEVVRRFKSKRAAENWVAKQ